MASKKRQHSSSGSRSPCSDDEQDFKRKKIDPSETDEKQNNVEDIASNEENELLQINKVIQSPISGESINPLEENLMENYKDLEIIEDTDSEKIEDKSHKNNNEQSKLEENKEISLDMPVGKCMDTKNSATENEVVGNTEGKSSKETLIDNTNSDKDDNENEILNDSVATSSDSDDSTNSNEQHSSITTDSANKKQETPNKKLTTKQLRQQEREKMQIIRQEKLKKKLEEKLKKKELKDQEIKQKQKEKELRKKEKEEKEEKKKKEREEKEQKRKEKEEQKRKEREEKQKKLQEIEEKNKEKLKEEEKKQKAAAAFVNFFVAKKPDDTPDEKKVQSSNFLQFEVKSDMKLPLPRRECLSNKQKEHLETCLNSQDEKASYLKDLASGKRTGKSTKTWPYEEFVDDDVIVVLGETICEDKSSLQRYRAKFFFFHENRRPPYHGTWRKTSKYVKPKKPLVQDKDIMNYEEDSDDDWEEEEQGESLNCSEDEADKENEDEKDDYEVDNDFFVPHGHLSEDEVDDEETARLSPESLKQKLKLLKEEFDEDMQSKTHKLKPRSIGCIWYNKDGSNVEEAVDKYLQPLVIIARGQIIIKSRADIFAPKEKKKVLKELDPELVPLFLKMVHCNSNKKSVLVDQFLSDLEKTGNVCNVSKRMVIRALRKFANWQKYRDHEGKRYKFRWFVDKEVREKYSFEEKVNDS